MYHYYMSRKYTTTHRLILTLILLFLYFAMLLFTNPFQMSLIFLITPFLLLFLAMYFGFSLVFDKLLVIQRSEAVKHRLSIVMAALPVTMLVLQSIGQLTTRDVLVSASFLVILVFYFVRADF
jgi:hypothetical protein